MFLESIKIRVLILSTACLAIAASGCEYGGASRQEPGAVSSRDMLIDPSAIDPTTKPCDDFYQYACGGWMKDFQLPADKTSFTKSFNVINDRNLEIENEILQSYSRGDFAVPSKYARKLGQFYASCMNVDAIEKDTPAFVAKALARVDALGDKSALAPLVAELQLQGASVLFGFGPDSDMKDSNKQIAEFSQGGMGLPNNSYYLDDKNAEARERYVLHVANMMKLAGLNESDAQAAATTVMRIETTLARAALRQEELMDPVRLYNPTDLAGIHSQLSAFDVDAFFATLGLNGVTFINVTEPRFLKQANELIDSTSLADLKTYLKWQLIHAAAPSLGADYSNESFAFNGTYLHGQKQMEPRWKTCVRATESAMGEALGEAYVNKTFGADGKKKTQEMIAKIRDAFRENLATVDWLDDATRAKAAQKLEKVLPKIGFPDKFREYDKLAVSDRPIENVVAAVEFEAKRQLGQIGQPVDKSQWGMFPQTVNAYYNPSWNEIVFPAGILQSPFFSKDATDGANFGAIGIVMGHELTHGFDSSGRQFDGDGNLIDWWTKNSSDAFDHKTSCMIEQYSKYEVVPGVFLNGKQTLTENIADLGGVKLAYHAFKKIAATRPPMESVGGFNETQQFFLSFAQAWCTIQTPENAKYRALTDFHSAPRYRIIGSLVNTPAFAEAFGCTVGSAMAPKDHCSLW